MRLSHLILATASALALVAPASAAQLLRFRLTGELNTSWTLPASAEPDFLTEYSDFTAFSFLVWADGIPTISVFQIGDGGGFFNGFTFGTGGGVLFDAEGPRLYSGTPQNPTFLPGVYTLTRFDELYPGNGTLTISVIPEPATWALMIAGFGLVGSALRRRQVVAAA